MAPVPLRASGVEQALAAGEDVARAAQGGGGRDESSDRPVRHRGVPTQSGDDLVRRAIEEAMGRS
jgi:hypothetical protein